MVAAGLWRWLHQGGGGGCNRVVAVIATALWWWLQQGGGGGCIRVAAVIAQRCSGGCIRIVAVIVAACSQLFKVICPRIYRTWSSIMITTRKTSILRKSVAREIFLPIQAMACNCAERANVVPALQVFSYTCSRMTRTGGMRRRCFSSAHSSCSTLLDSNFIASPSCLVLFFK